MRAVWAVLAAIMADCMKSSTSCGICRAKAMQGCRPVTVYDITQQQGCSRVQCPPAGCEDGALVVWDLPTRQPVRTLQMPAKGPISAVLVMDRPMFLPGQSVADATLERPPETDWDLSSAEDLWQELVRGMQVWSSNPFEHADLAHK